MERGFGGGGSPATPRSRCWNAEAEVPRRRRGAAAARKEDVKCILSRLFWMVDWLPEPSEGMGKLRNERAAVNAGVGC